MAENEKQTSQAPAAGVFSNTPANSGALVDLYFENYGATHLYSIKLLFSLKNKKFIRPMTMRNKHFEYKVLEGEYIIIQANGHRDNKTVKWKVQLVKITASGNKIEVLKEVEWETPLYMSQRTVSVLKDIRVPDFHEFTKVNFNKTYSEEEINQLLQGGIDPGLLGEME